MTSSIPRQATVEITYIKKKKAGAGKKYASSVMAEYNEGFTYVDPASGESDTIDITLTNEDMRWLNKWKPKKGDKITAKIVEKSWNKEGESKSFSCGKFCLDDLSYSGPELTCSIGGLSVPEKNAFRSTNRDKTWRKVTIRIIAVKIAKRYHLKLKYYGKKIKIGTIRQSGETDSSFLKKICEEYGMELKVYYGKLILYDKSLFEKKAPVSILTKTDLQEWSYNSTITGTYTGAKIKYTSGKSGRTLKCKVGKGKRILNINEKAENLREARLKACAKVNLENEKAETLTATIMANNKIAAGCTVTIKDFASVSGKYFVDKVTHTIEADGAYTMNLEMHKCQKRITKATSQKVK